MVIFAIMDDITNLHRPDHHHMLVLYPGCENYDSLSVALSLLRTVLRELSEIGINIIGLIGLLIFISVLIENSFPSVWVLIPQIASFFVRGVKENQTWNFTLLVGGDKLKVLQFFNLGKVLSPSQAKIIRRLWNEFHELYVAMSDPATDSETFKKNAEYWLRLFLTPSIRTPNDKNFFQGLYRPNDLIPYFHVLVYHVHEFMKKTKKWGLKAFSCAPVEKKNHQQVSQFFHKTLRDGSNSMDQKSAII
ncbi:hypothetical protein GLOIN_2v1477112 [Rhizophagus clarus]|uniref:Uncharacterized protein n=1 Tax=Rhizophagus clarus TaxID=94130 RepID=A0A8H3MHK1_9GLOM|nr:hypothetical protein GLOIN_2v1477112 [Rhizophagus clarus]